MVLLLSGPSSNAAGKVVSERVETEREREREGNRAGMRVKKCSSSAAVFSLLLLVF